MSAIQQIINDANHASSKRRRFQPPITSFFSLAGGSNNLDSEASTAAPLPRFSHTHYSAATSSPTPLVPAKIQSSLLSVGMRVRKSIAEGYKTKAGQKQPSAFPFAAASSSSSSGLDSPLQPLAHPAPVVSRPVLSDEGDAYSLPSSSQESTCSSSLPLSRPYKRSYDAEGDLDDFDFLTNEPIFPSTSVPMTSSLSSSSGSQRIILSPKLGQQRRQFHRRSKYFLGQENMVHTGPASAMDVDDFEEPTFLRSREEVDIDYVSRRGMHYEVEMGGL
ncbi:hypothetical protein ASPZODRAFT_17034 [Penicilliopsis zonata CBS 506.65]|uniref:Uncharacterized protein n=1 Tax=Penicilliopsis zonata CBS 506.65 TaxID=1073090 RepID=A0A1L9SEP9_9EURO|nr:hypothetical protein ASPZODRAFT_17034 [Penicilliopsis zonata CBS 506.65]OJJ45583.1 hypothetical protein ASPZODRAFT_17034 [Penicilliopsis zonata CBS 506.65]